MHTSAPALGSPRPHLHRRWAHLPTSAPRDCRGRVVGSLRRRPARESADNEGDSVVRATTRSRSLARKKNRAHAGAGTSRTCLASRRPTRRCRLNPANAARCAVARRGRAFAAAGEDLFQQHDWRPLGVHGGGVGVVGAQLLRRVMRWPALRVRSGCGTICPMPRVAICSIVVRYCFRSMRLPAVASLARRKVV